MERLLIHTRVILSSPSVEGRAAWLACLWRRTAVMWAQGVCLHAMFCPLTTVCRKASRLTDCKVGVVILPDSISLFLSRWHLEVFRYSWCGGLGCSQLSLSAQICARRLQARDFLFVETFQNLHTFLKQVDCYLLAHRGRNSDFTCCGNVDTKVHQWEGSVTGEQIKEAKRETR